MSEESTVIASATGLSKIYGKFTALNAVSFQVRKGDILGLVGKNGAGKTTLLRILSSIATPTSGSFTLFGDSEKKALTADLKRISTMIERPALYESMTAQDNMAIACSLKGGNSSEAYIADKLAFVGLSGMEKEKRKVRNYSLGMKQRLGIAIAMIGEPELMILDEPTNGLDPEGIKEIREVLLRLNQEKNVTIIIASHILSELEKLAKEYVFLDQGKVVCAISATELDAESAKSLTIATNDNAKALQVLQQNAYQVAIYGTFLVITNIQNPAPVLNLLFKAGFTLTFLKEKQHDLEDFFHNLVGGKTI